MVTFGSTDETSTRIRQYSKELYKNLEKETGQSTGFKPVGFIELATNSDYLHEFRRVATFNRAMGIDVHEISPAEVAGMFPLCKVDDVLAGFYVEDDGRVNPVDVTMALAKGAKMQGVRYFEGTICTGVSISDGKVEHVETTEGIIKTDYLVNCAGMWARQFGELAGVSIPNQAAEHYYLVTEPIDSVQSTWPVIEDPSSYTYIRPETNGGLMVGLFEPKAAAWNVKSVPKDFSFGEITPDWDRMTPYLEKAMNRVPITLETGARTFFCGPESFTPDLNPIVGKAPQLENYFVAAGMNSIGILSGGGIGKELASWIVNGRPDVDVSAMDILRFEKYQSNSNYRRDRVTEALGIVYKNHFPNYQMKTARGVKRSPLHDALKQKGAFFRPVSGWEAADWYGEQQSDGILGWNKESWFPNWEREHTACREGVALFDMSFMSKFHVTGKDSGPFLEFLSTASVSKVNNSIVYTQWLDEKGKIQADLTVAKAGNDSYWVIASDNMRNKVFDWMNRHSKDRQVNIVDVTGGYAQLNIQGPLSRKLLQSVVAENLSDEHFPFREFREIELGYARVFASRITYVGELGYELFIPVEHAMHVYQLVEQAGVSFGLTHAGLKALSSLRLEKGYRDFGHDIDNTDGIVTAGLSFTCDMNKTFLGREAVEMQKAQGIPTSRLVQILVLDPDCMMFHAEVIRKDGVIMGFVRSASYGHTLKGSVGLALLNHHASITTKVLNTGTWTVEIAGQIFPCKCSLAPMYDPKNVNIKS